MYFTQAGKENTEATLKLAKEEAEKRKIRYLVVASTGGETGLKAAQELQGSPIKLIVVSHNTGFKEAGVQEFDPEKKKEIERLGGIVYTGTMVLRGLGSAIRTKTGYSEELLVADTLRILGQGIKVCVEISAMVSDAGLIPAEDIIAVAGTGRGADTALVIAPQPSNNFFALKIREILAKPRNF